MTFDRKTLLATTMIAGVALLAPSYALAQSAPASGASASDKKSTEVEEVVVTGSRIKRNEFTSAAPIQVITSEESTLEGLSSTTQMLQQSSLAAGSFQVNNELTGFVTTGGPGANTLSLRGLGATRTLVLLNGRRVPPAGVRGTVGPVDLNVIPDSIIDRVEILKDGASSIYGSDAVAGVVNIITKKNLDGVALDIYGNRAAQDGGAQFRVNGVWGKTFDRGYINVSAAYNEQGALRRGQRKDTTCASDYEFENGSRAPVDYIDQKTHSAQCYTFQAGDIQTGNYGNLIYPEAGYVYPDAAHGNAGGSNNAAGGFTATPTPFGMARLFRTGFPDTYTYTYPAYSQALSNHATVLSPSKNYNLFVTGAFDLTADTQAYGELLWDRRVSVQTGLKQVFPSVNVANPNVPAGWETPGATQIGSLLPIVGFNIDTGQDVDYTRGLAGVRGKLGDIGFLKGWDWDVFAQYSKSSGDYFGDAFYNDRVVATTGATACNVAPAGGNLSNFTCTGFPTGIPWLSQRFLLGQWTDAEKAFLEFRNNGHTDYTQQMVEATLTGDLFQLPAGPVGAAVGVSWRRDHIDDQPSAQEQAGNLWGSSSSGHTVGSDTVKEYFGEVDVPILKGLPAFQSLDLQASGRHTDYKSYGASNTYKVGLNWQIIPSIRLRATQGTSFRAPALYELYLAHQTSFAAQNANLDPCINWQANPNTVLQTNCNSEHIDPGYAGAGSSATITTGGGAGILKAETSKAKTIGVIWTPRFIDLSVAVDYSDIVVNNEVTRFGAFNILLGCYGVNTYPNNPFCQLFTRDNAQFLPGGAPNPNWHRILTVNNSYTNVATQTNHALDLTTRYRHDFDFGRLTVNSQFTWQLKNTTQLSSLFAPTDPNGSTNLPDFNGINTVRFDHGDWTVFWSSQFIAKSSDAGLSTNPGDQVSSQKYSTTCNFEGQGLHTCNDPTYFGHFRILSASGAVSASGSTPTVPRLIYSKRYEEFTVYHTISVRKKMDSWTFQAGIQNVFDERPPHLSANETRIGTTAVFNYDEVGRRAFVEVTKRW